MKPLALLLVGLTAMPVLGDVVHLNDGSIVEGEVHRTNDGYDVVQFDGKTTRVPAEQVRSIDLKKNERSPAESPDQQLAGIRRSAGNLSDIHQIIDRYKAFIAQNQGAPAAKDARKDLAQWQDRLNHEYVKVGDKWVTKEKQAELAESSLETARVAQQLIKEGRLKEAGPVLDKALADDPHSPAALYLKGLLLYRADQLVAARKAFETVIESVPDHGPSMNNVAVILWRQHTPVAALVHYDKALTASPADRTILDNIAEALNSLAPEHRNVQATKRLVAHFNDQDKELQQKMQEKGLFRWGSSWVTEAQLDKLQAAEKAVKDKVDAIQAKLDDVTGRLIRIDREIQDDTNLKDAIRAQTIVQDPASGRVFYNPLPQRYFDVVQDIKSLAAEKKEKLLERQHLMEEIKREQQKLPAPKYAGVQKLFDANGMPDPAARPTSPPPATQSASALAQ